MGRYPALTARVYINGRPYEELTPQEREEAGRRITEKLGNYYNDWFGRHPDVYVRLCQRLDREATAKKAVSPAAAQIRKGGEHDNA